MSQLDDDKTRTDVPLTNGTMVSHYRIIEKIGAGGMGEVYLADDTQLNRKVALKFLPPHLCQNADCRARFKREAQAAAKLSHQNLITIYEVNEFLGRPYFAMEYLEALPLDIYLKEKKPSLDTIIDIAVQISDGLKEAHTNGIIHRDIKPGNILLDKNGRAKILDFGLAVIKGDMKITKSGSTLGTASYMSPEQTRGEELDQRSDIFSFGVVLYEMITGHLPFKGDHEPAVIYSIGYEEPEPLSRYKSGVSPELQSTIDKALAKDKALRYQDMEDMIVDLKRNKEALSPPARVAPIHLGQRKRISLLVILAAMVLFFISALIVYLGIFSRNKTPLIAKQKQLTFVGDVKQCALSPDGTYMAYGEYKNAKARVLIRDLQGGEPLLVTDCDNVYFLHWSPSGAELMMGIVTGGEYVKFMLVSRLGGPAREYLGGNAIGHTGYESAAWSPDGASFVAHSGFSGRPFCFVDKKSGDTSLVNVKTAGGWLKNITWSPNGDRLLFRIDASKGTSYWTMKTDGKELSEVPCGTGFSNCWSLKGDALYYFAQGQESVSLMKQKIDPIKGTCRGEPQELLSGLQTSGPISVSADGDKLIYPRSDYSSNLWLVVTGDSGRIDSIVQITFGTARVTDPAFSPDGKMFAFAVAEAGEQHIYTMPLAGGARKRLTYTMPINFGPSWSADGQQIAFICWRKDAYRIALMNSDGSHVRYFDSTVVTSVPDVNSCTWGAKQFLLYQKEGNRNFGVLDIETGLERPLILNDTVGWLFRPTFSPDGKTLAAYWNRSLERQSAPAGRGIWIMALDGGNQNMIFHRDSLYAPLGWSPDGGSIYLYSSEISTNPEILRLPANGGQLGKTTVIPLRDITSIAMSPDCRSFICCVGDRRSDLWLVQGFDPEIK